MRSGPNSGKRISSARSPNRGRRVVSISAKARRPVIEHHTPQWWEHESKKHGVVRCSTCGAYFVHSHWIFAPTALEKKFATVARAATCPACASERAHGVAAAEGELLIKGLSLRDRPQALQTIAGFAARERARNAESRLLSVDIRGADIRILTTQNHLAIRLGKKLNESRKGGRLDIAYSKDDYPARAVWTAPRR